MSRQNALMWRWLGMILTGLASFASGSSVARAAGSAASASSGGARDIRLVFTGDILLAREVEHEIERRAGQSPWLALQEYWRAADWVQGNFESSVGSSRDCVANAADPQSKLCFATSASRLNLLKSAGFTAVSVENNHSGDLGAAGRLRTREALENVGLAPLDFAHSPGFYRAHDRVFALIAVNAVPGRDGQSVAIPSTELSQKIRLARALADWVVVSVHWGAELADWVTPRQRAKARWLVKQGADLIIGHHPHVVQLPECIGGRPVFFSLGNHVFDQKYPATKRGLLADCHVRANRLICRGVATQTSMDTSFPSLAPPPGHPMGAGIEICGIARPRPISVDGYQLRPRLAEGQYISGELVLEGRKTTAQRKGSEHWDVVAKRLLTLGSARFMEAPPHGRLPSFLTKNYLFTLEAHLSPIDQEVGPRPYVYEVGAHGLIAKWRGSALAWPLVDALILPSDAAGVDYLCALHRKDSFIELDPDSLDTRTALYRWNGFGFSGVGNATESETARCARAFASVSRSAVNALGASVDRAGHPLTMQRTPAR